MNGKFPAFNVHMSSTGNVHVVAVSYYFRTCMHRVRWNVATYTIVFMSRTGKEAPILKYSKYRKCSFFSNTN